MAHGQPEHLGSASAVVDATASPTCLGTISPAARTAGSTNEFAQRQGCAVGAPWIASREDDTCRTTAGRRDATYARGEARPEHYLAGVRDALNAPLQQSGSPHPAGGAVKHTIDARSRWRSDFEAGPPFRRLTAASWRQTDELSFFGINQTANAQRSRGRIQFT